MNHTVLNKLRISALNSDLSNTVDANFDLFLYYATCVRCNFSFSRASDSFLPVSLDQDCSLKVEIFVPTEALSKPKFSTEHSWFDGLRSRVLFKIETEGSAESKFDAEEVQLKQSLFPQTPTASSICIVFKVRRSKHCRPSTTFSASALEHRGWQRKMTTLTQRVDGKVSTVTWVVG